MNLYAIRRRDGVRTGQKAAMVVRERTAEDARRLAQCNAGKEGAEAWARGKVDVRRLSASGRAEVILAAHQPSSALASLPRSRLPMSRRGLLATLARAVAG